jgi:hypothetical protein
MEHFQGTKEREIKSRRRPLRDRNAPWSSKWRRIISRTRRLACSGEPRPAPAAFSPILSTVAHVEPSAATAEPPASGSRSAGGESSRSSSEESRARDAAEGFGGLGPWRCWSSMRTMRAAAEKAATSRARWRRRGGERPPRRHRAGAGGMGDGRSRGQS